MLRKSKKVSPGKGPSISPLNDPQENEYVHDADPDTSPTPKSSLNKRLPSVYSKTKQRSKVNQSNSTPDKTRESEQQDRLKAKLELNYLIKNVDDTESIFQPGGGETAETIMNTTKLIEAHTKSVQKEFAFLSTIKDQPSTAFENALPEKNRYLDIPCIDTNRVILKESSDGEDYIHANYVDSYKHSKAYICCQGPKAGTAEDFWHMIWQENTFVIAMLTKCIENNKRKCSEYWPIIQDTSITFGIYTVHAKYKKIRTNYEYTQLILTRNDQSEERAVVHTLFTAWPDNGIPDDVTKFLGFVDIVRKAQKGFMEKYRIVRRVPWTGHPLGPPIVVHCSAGIGRTGTFCVVDICCRKLLDTGRVDISDTVRLIRTQRARSVQKIEQYLFVYFSIICFSKSTGMIVVTKDKEKEI